MRRCPNSLVFRVATGALLMQSKVSSPIITLMCIVFSLMYLELNMVPSKWIFLSSCELISCRAMNGRKKQDLAGEQISQKIICGLLALTNLSWGRGGPWQGEKRVCIGREVVMPFHLGSCIECS
jgi:hypothetical protein